MARTIGGIVAGIVAGFAVIWAIEMIGHLVYPVPSDLAMTDRQRLGEFVSAMPLGAQLFVFVAWLAGALVGGVVAGRISRRHWAVWLITGLVALAALINIFWIPHPVLLQIGAVVAPLIGGLIASRMVPRTAAGTAA